RDRGGAGEPPRLHRPLRTWHNVSRHGVRPVDPASRDTSRRLKKDGYSPYARYQALQPAGQRDFPDVIQLSNASTCSFGQAPSQGIDPARTDERMPSAWATTSSYDQRSKANCIDARSPWRNRGLMCVSKLSDSPSFGGTKAAFCSPS